MSERDELGTLIMEEANANGLYMGIITTDNMADAILAAGYRKPQQVTTVEELDALPEGAVVVEERTGNSAQKDHEGYWFLWGGDLALGSEDLGLPATVLHVGGSNG